MNADIEVSVVLPCLNEEASVGICINKIKDVFNREGIRGQIIVADNGSIDRSRQIALAAGAEVVTEAERGVTAQFTWQAWRRRRLNL